MEHVDRFVEAMRGVSQDECRDRFVREMDEKARTVGDANADAGAAERVALEAEEARKERAALVQRCEEAMELLEALKERFAFEALHAQKVAENVGRAAVRAVERDYDERLERMMQEYEAVRREKEERVKEVSARVGEPAPDEQSADRTKPADAPRKGKVASLQNKFLQAIESSQGTQPPVSREKKSPRGPSGRLSVVGASAGKSEAPKPAADAPAEARPKPAEEAPAPAAPAPVEPKAEEPKPAEPAAVETPVAAKPSVRSESSDVAVPPSSVSPGVVITAVTPRTPRDGMSPSVSRFHSDGDEDIVINDAIPQLKQWIQKEQCETAYDSMVDPFTKEAFYLKTLNKPNIMIIGVTTDDDIFGGYLSIPVDCCDTNFQDRLHFLFSLESHGRCPTPRFFQRREEYLGRNAVRFCQSHPYGFLSFGSGLSEKSYIFLGNRQSNSYCNNLSKEYEDLEDTTLTGKTGTNQFHSCRRVVVIQFS